MRTWMRKRGNWAKLSRPSQHPDNAGGRRLIAGNNRQAILSQPCFPCSFDSLHLYLYSFLLSFSPPPSSPLHSLLSPTSIYIYLFIYIISYHIYRFCQNHSSSLFMLLLFVQIILSVLRVITLYQSTIIHLFISLLGTCFMHFLLPPPPIIANNLNFNFTVEELLFGVKIRSSDIGRLKSYYY